MNWDRVKNKPFQPLEFAAVHDNFAWRKHHSSRFGVLKSKGQKYASDSLSRAFKSELDSIPQLFVGRNRVSRENPDYGPARFAVVWYEDEEWAILCTPKIAALINSSLITGFKRERDGAQQRMRFLEGVLANVEISEKIPLSEVVIRIA